MHKTHTYDVGVEWTGSRGQGTTSYRAYDRTHVVTASGRPPIAGSSDVSFRGDAARWNPEQLLVASLSQCHLLAYLHLAATAHVVVTGYTDAATGTLQTHEDGSGEMTLVVLHPTVEVAEADMVERALALHDEAHRVCFVARSVLFPVLHDPVVRLAPSAEVPA
jgi:organic hydroperoxide reductase OsmC/OhrA